MIGVEAFGAVGGFRQPRAQLLKGRVEIAFLADTHFDRQPANGAAGVADARFTQSTLHILRELFGFFLADVVGIDLEQDVRAALQVEPEHHVPLRPRRPTLQGRIAEKVRNGEQADDERRQQRPERLPP